MQTKDLAPNFKDQLQCISQVYLVAEWGSRHQEVRILKWLEILGSEYAKKRLASQELRDTIKEVDAIRNGLHIAENDKETLLSMVKKYPSSLGSEEDQNRDSSIDLDAVRAYRKSFRRELKLVQKIPRMAREQAIISLVSVYEGYIADIFGAIFDACPDAFKTDQPCSLSDKTLVDSLKRGDTLDVFKKEKIRSLMARGSVDVWVDSMSKKFGLDVPSSRQIEEMFLVRNCLVHNNGIIDKELSAHNKKFIINRKLTFNQLAINVYLSYAEKNGLMIFEIARVKFFKDIEPVQDF